MSSAVVATGLEGSRSDKVQQHRLPYRPDIDGLRAIAVLAVVLYHADLPIVRSGFSGVDIFFVISGYLIGGIIYTNTLRNSFSFFEFYGRRARRILPALIFVAIATTIASLLVLSPTELSRASRTIGYALVGTSNIYLWAKTNYFSPDSHLDPFLMSWSLGVEEQFYIALPIILILLRKFDRSVVMSAMFAMTLVSFAICLYMTNTHHASAFYLLPSRAWELGAGCLIAILRSPPGHRLALPLQQASSALGLAALGVSICALDGLTFPGYAAVLPVLGASLLIVGEESWISRHILSSGPMVGIGRISYSWYLWHWPLIAFAWICSPGRPAHSTLLIAAIASLALAWLSWWLIERRWRRAVRPHSQVLIAYSAAIAACLVPLLVLRFSNGAPERASPRVRAIEAQAHLNGLRCLHEDGDVSATAKPECLDARNLSRVAVVGDSHAAALAPSFRRMAAEKGLGFDQFTKASCPPVTPPLPMGEQDACARFLGNSIDYIVNTPRITTVILAGYWDLEPGKGAREEASNSYSEQTARREHAAEGLLAIVHSLQQAGKHVIIVEDVPRFKFDPVKQAISEAMPARNAIQQAISAPSRVKAGWADRTYVDAPNARLSRAVEDVAAASGSTWVPTRRNFCTVASCEFMHDGALLFFDREHLTEAGASRALSNFNGDLSDRRSAEPAAGE